LGIAVSDSIQHKATGYSQLRGAAYPLHNVVLKLKSFKSWQYKIATGIFVFTLGS